MAFVAEDSGNIPKLLLTDSDGVLYVSPKHGTYKYVQISDDTSGTTGTIWDPAAGKGIHLNGVFFYASGAGTVELYDNASGTTILLFEFTAQGVQFVPIGADVTITADNVLGAKWTSGAGTRTLDVSVFGHEH